MNRIIMKRGGVKEVATLLRKHRVVVMRALSGRCVDTPENLRIRKCAINHGGVEISDGDGWHANFACSAMKPERMTFHFANGATLEIREPEQAIEVTLPDGRVDRYELGDDLRLCDLRGLQAMAMNI